jgi:hypothetical protein
MKLRHAAALALAGWYLLVPPVLRAPDGHARANPAAPLSKWKFFGVYPTEEECRRDEVLLHRQADDRTAFAWLLSAYKDNGFVWTPSDLREYLLARHCVASNDRRLKEK